jgi:hypothetical protein
MGCAGYVARPPENHWEIPGASLISIRMLVPFASADVSVPSPIVCKNKIDCKSSNIPVVVAEQTTEPFPASDDATSPI